MKNIAMILLGSVLFMVTACRQVDQELVDKMDAKATEVNQVVPVLETSLLRSAELLKKMDMAPNALKFNPAYNYAELNEMATAIKGKYSTVLEICKESTYKLDSLKQTYTNGKIKKDAAAAELAAISASLDGIPQVNARVTPVFDEVSSNFAKLMATWEALPADQKAKAEKALLSTSVAPAQKK